MSKAKQSKVQSGILWEGSSLIDGSPIVAIITTDSRNSKTGAMPQTWILRTDTDPLTANRKGLDYAICGNCPHRGMPDLSRNNGTANNRSCYVTLQHAPLSVYRAYKRGSYPVLSNEQLQSIVSGQTVRIGSYGDGAAVPAEIWQNIRMFAAGVTAYTHQGLQQDSTFMISADNLSVAQSAWSIGKRTFRIVQDYSEKQPNEVICPSSKGIQCADCGLCDGSKQAKSVVIQVHGTGQKHFKGSTV